MKVLNSNKVKDSLYINGNNDSFVFDPKSGSIILTLPKSPEYIYVTFTITNGWEIKEPDEK